MSFDQLVRTIKSVPINQQASVSIPDQIIKAAKQFKPNFTLLTRWSVFSWMSKTVSSVLLILRPKTTNWSDVFSKSIRDGYIFELGKNFTLYCIRAPSDANKMPTNTRSKAPAPLKKNNPPIQYNKSAPRWAA